MNNRRLNQALHVCICTVLSAVVKLCSRRGPRAAISTCSSLQSFHKALAALWANASYRLLAAARCAPPGRKTSSGGLRTAKAGRSKRRMHPSNSAPRSSQQRPRALKAHKKDCRSAMLDGMSNTVHLRVPACSYVECGASPPTITYYQ